VSEPVFQPLVRNDGSLDPASFERMGDSWIERWLEERLSSRDPHFPVDIRAGEDPEAFVVGLLRQAGPVHSATLAISRSVLRLLDEARRLAPRTPPWLSPLLRICQQVRLDLVFSWFREELQTIASDSDAARQRWGDPRTIRDILLAAALQVPGRSPSPAIGAWLALLKTADFSSLALAGLGSSFEQKLPYLADWWTHCPPDRRGRELKYLIYRALDQEEPIHVLLMQAPTFPPDLCEAIDQELQAQGAQSFFDTWTPELSRKHPAISFSPRSKKVNKVFISYSHEDQRWRDRLAVHLKALENVGELEVWDDKKVAPGESWRDNMLNAINEVSIAIMLISADYLSSEFVARNEVPHLLKKRTAGSLRIIPLLLRPCAWRLVPWLGALEVRPRDGKPLTQHRFSDIEELFSEITEEILDLASKDSLDAASSAS
jgi:TIR domain-containing protein